MDWEATDLIQAFQEFRAIADSATGLEYFQKDQYCKIVWDPKAAKHDTAFLGMTVQTKKTQAKYLIYLTSFLTSNKLWSYCKEAYNLKQEEDETVEQLDIRLTNMFFICSYPWDQLDKGKVKVLFNLTKYFNIKQCITKQPLTLNYQDLLDKCKAHKTSFIHYCKIQDSMTTTLETNTVAAGKYKASKSHQSHQTDRHL